MKLTTFTDRGGTRIGVVVGDRMVDLSRAAPDLPRDMIGFLGAGRPAIEIARAAASRSGAGIPLGAVRLEAPVPRPGKFLGIGANYPNKDNRWVDGSMLENLRANGDQIWFNKQITCIVGPYDPIELPRGSNQVICETELALVIGRRCRRVTREEAAECIAGYTVCDDVTAVDWALRSPTITLGKSFDSHGPIGPWIVTPDEIPYPQALELRTYVNGEERPKGHTSGMLFNCLEMVSYLSQVVTLEPGDILTTGSPRQSHDFLKAGDVVRCEVEGIGWIENVARAGP